MRRVGAVAGGDTMALAAVVDSLDGVPEDLREHYEQDGDVFRIRVDGYDDTGLKATLEDLKGKNLKLRKKLEHVPDNFDIAELEELRKLRQTIDDDRARAAGDWDKLKGDLEARHQKERESLADRLAASEKQLDAIVRRDAATTALADAGAIVNAMLPHVLDRVDVVVEDGTRRAVAKGLDGEATDISGLVSQMQEAGGEWAWGFQASGATGGGSGSRGGAGRAGSIRTKADLGDANSADGQRARSEFIRANGLEAFKALPAA